MLRRVEIEGVSIPRLYIAENNDDVRIAMNSGIPFIKWRKGVNELVRVLLRPTLEKMFPGIDWNKVIGRRNRVFNSDVITVPGCEIETEVDYTVQDDRNGKVQEMLNEYERDLVDVVERPDREEEVVDIADSKREFSIGANENSFVQKLTIEDYIGDLSSHVNIDVLQKLNLLPKFIGDICNCIKVNLSNRTRWTEGYNKKLGVPIGNFSASRTLPNLIILDVSGSIPRGISATMLTLIDTMRDQLDAELIITSDKSVYYGRDDELPSPQTLRDYFGYGNEAKMFYGILENKIKGREFGHVISFGDYDCPEVFKGWRNSDTLRFPDMSGTKIHAVHHYHTKRFSRTGYAEWCHDIEPKIEDHYDTSWCNVIRKDW